MSDQEEPDPNVGTSSLTLTEFRSGFAKIHHDLGIPMPDSLT